MTKEKILRGWESTGIFPRELSKPLNSRLTMKANAVTLGEPERPKTPDQDLEMVEIQLQTPRNS